MKTGEYKRFNKNCGIAKVYNEVNKKDYFVVYGTTLPNNLIDSGELGDAVGKGDTLEEAYIDAIKNLMNRIKNVEKSIETFLSKVSRNNFLESTEVILPTKSLEYKHDYETSTTKIIETDELENAGIAFNEEGAFECNR